MDVKRDLAGRTVAITGANGGIGSQIALGLARTGAHVVLICRTGERARRAEAFVRSSLPTATVSVMSADLSTVAATRQLASELSEQHPQLSVLVNNAGLIAPRRSLTPDGFESTIAVNHLAPFVLSTALLNALRANAPARIVNVNSDAHLDAPFDLDDLNSARRFWPPRAYAQSKLANMLFTVELAHRVDPAQVTVNALHPGLVNTDFGQVGGVVGFGWWFVRRTGISARDGASTPIFVASSPELAGVSGVYFRNCHAARPDPRVTDVTLRERLWDTTEALIRNAER